jgi:hypothetical protein
MNKNAVIDPGLVEIISGNLRAAITHRQEALGLNNTDIGERTGLNRLTIQRSREETADPKLSTVIGMAMSVGLTPVLIASGEGAHRQHEAAIIHRGLAHNRLKRDPEWKDVQREKALAESWEAVNESVDVGLAPIMQTLVPDHDQAQASAAATAIQWLGSEVGFAFLQKALARAGYSVVETSRTGNAKKKGR